MFTAIEIATFISRERAERVRAKLVAACGSAFWSPRFTVSPCNGSIILRAETEYDFAHDAEGNEQDAEKEFGAQIMAAVAFQLGEA